MPFPFRLPTTAFLSFPTFITSETHPSLPLAATTTRGVVRTLLKKHKRLRGPAQAPHLRDVLTALEEYVPLLIAIDAGLSGAKVSGEEIDVVLIKEFEVQWRPVLTSGPPGREMTRIRLHSLEYEILFAISALACTHYLIAQSTLHAVYVAGVPAPEQRSTIISTAMRHLLDAHGIYAFLSQRAGQVSIAPPVPDVAPSTFSALASLALAEATLVAVFKDDPYAAIVAQERNKYDKEWMYKAPDMTSVRASLFARLCVASADHASKAGGLIGHGRKVLDDLPKYVNDLRQTARAKACRFLAIDAELAGRTGEGIAWLRTAQSELGFEGTSAGDRDGKKRIGFSRLKKDWAEKREDKKIEKGGDWGTDAGRFEEARVVDMLHEKWSKMNSIMNVQTIPASESLITKVPSGREFHSPNTWIVPMLDSTSLVMMRVPPVSNASEIQEGEEDSDDDEVGPSAPTGALAGTERHSSGRNYY